jgi:hypothetical protein
MKTIFKEGDKVFDISFGWGEVVEILNGPYNYPIMVDFNDKYHYYTLDGRYVAGFKPTLAFIEYTLEGFSQERPVTFEEGEWVAVSDSGKDFCLRRYVSENKAKNNNGVVVYCTHIKKLTDFNK